MRLEHHENQILVLHDLHRITAGPEHRARHAGAQAETAGRLAARIDERVVGIDFGLRFGPQRQRRLRRTALRRRGAGRAIVAPDAGEVRAFGGERRAGDAQAEQRSSRAFERWTSDRDMGRIPRGISAEHRGAPRGASTAATNLDRAGARAARARLRRGRARPREIARRSVRAWPGRRR